MPQEKTNQLEEPLEAHEMKDVAGVEDFKTIDNCILRLCAWVTTSEEDKILANIKQLKSDLLRDLRANHITREEANALKDALLNFINVVVEQAENPALVDREKIKIHSDIFNRACVKPYVPIGTKMSDCVLRASESAFTMSSYAASVCCALLFSTWAAIEEMGLLKQSEPLFIPNNLLIYSLISFGTYVTFEGILKGIISIQKSLEIPPRAESIINTVNTIFERYTKNNFNDFYKQPTLAPTTLYEIGQKLYYLKELEYCADPLPASEIKKIFREFLSTTNRDVRLLNENFINRLLELTPDKKSGLTIKGLLSSENEENVEPKKLLQELVANMENDTNVLNFHPNG